MENNMDYKDFIRKPFLVGAVEVTPENIAEIAPLVGILKEKTDGTPFIQVNQRLVPNVFRVYPGFWVTKLDDTIRCYSKKAFFAQFTEATDDLMSLVEDHLETVSVE